MKRRNFSSLVIGAGLAVALVVVNVALTFRNTRQLNEDAYWVSHTHEVIAGLENILSLAKDAETGQRGFVITGEPKYLEPYDDAVAQLDKEVDRVQKLTADNPFQQSHFPELRQDLAEKLAHLAELVTLSKNEGFDAARKETLTDRGKNAMDAVRADVAEMVESEEELLKERSEKSAGMYRVALLTGLATGLAALAAIAAFFWLLRRHLEARAQAAFVIAEQGERWRTTLASIGDAVITTDMQGVVTNLNSIAESLTGWKLDAAVGQPLSTVFHIVNETTRQPVANPVDKVLAEGVIVGLANHAVLIAKDGSERPIDDSAAPIRCKEGEIVGCVLVFRDVAERRSSEVALARSEQRLRFVMDSMPQKIFTATASGNVDYFNPIWSEYTGLTFEQIRDWGWTQFVHPDDLAENLRVWKSAIETGEEFTFEQRFRRADGEYRWHLSRAKALKDAEGKVLMWVGSNTDIHEQKQTANELREVAARLSEADRRKNEFLAMLAHELRNPLAPIRNGLQIVRMAEGNGETVRSTADMMERQIRQMVRLVDDLLDVSRITQGKIELRRERVELASIIQQAIETSRPAVEAAHHTLTVKVPTQPEYVNGDAVRLAQVFSNLLNNASKFTEPGGRISLMAEREGSDVVVTVQDSGMGIRPEMLPNVFEMFTQVDRSLERTQDGLGIGLTLVKRLVEMHGGSVTAASDGPGKGSTFVVRLPIVMDGQQPVTSGGSNGEAKGEPIRRILVVDDNLDSAKSLAMLLKLTGSETQTAHDGIEAVAAVAKFRPDVVLLDIGLPKLNGYEAARQIREQPGGREIVLVALTGWGQDEDRQKSREAGFDSHLVKPVELAELLTLLAELQQTSA
jgi:PAS domain S-box-containing protein